MSEPCLDLTFIILAYNEEDGLEPTTQEAFGFLDVIGRKAPILIIDDGSTDRTAEIADRLAAEHPDVEVFHQPRNMGQFAAIQKGLELARTRWFTILPGDNQFELATSGFDRFLPFLAEYDVVFGFPNNEAVRGRDRVFFSHVWRLYLLGLFGIHVTYLAGLVIAPVDLVRRISSTSTGFLGWYETMVRLVLSGARFIQAPFEMRDREGGESKAVNPTRNVADALRMLLVWRRIKGPGRLGPGVEWKTIRRPYEEYRAALEAKAEEAAWLPPTTTG